VNRDLARTKVAMLAADGVERAHAEGLRRGLEEVDVRVDLIGPQRGEIWAMDHLEKTATFPVDRPLRDTAAGDFDGLLIPGGPMGADHLRRDPAAVALVSDFAEAGKPIGAAGHAAWLLVESDLVRDRLVTAWPSLRTDILNAGGKWTDLGMCRDGTLLTCRGTDDLPALCKALLEAIG
jgi:protease I